MEKFNQLTFSNGLTAKTIQIQTVVELSAAIQKIGLQKPRPTLVLVGGASGLSDAYLSHLQSLFIEQIAPLIENLGACVVDGGTDAGVMKLMGKARCDIGGTFPLLGVAAIGTIMAPNVTPVIEDPAFLEPHHTHFILVPGNKWGDECKWIARLATVLSEGTSSVTMVVNGGKITFQDVSWSIKANRPVLVVAGSGRTADILTAAMRGEAIDEEVKALVSSRLLQAIDFTKDLNLLLKFLKEKLST